jgi:glycosyltransferase involved in cell wall biosynthesis
MAPKTDRGYVLPVTASPDTAPPLSVVMPARNALPYLDASIESVLGQSFGDFEFVIRDDGSTDGTAEALRAWAARDRRIRLFAGAQLGLAESSNWVVRQARAPIVARMDADDVARADRLERQMALLREQPDLVLATSLCNTIDGEGRQVRSIDLWRIVRHSCFVPFPHTSATFRRAAFEAVGGYRRQCEYWEDLDLFLRLAAQGRVAVIADELVSHRQSRVSSRLVAADRDRIEAAVERMYSCLDAHARGESYDPLIGRGAATADGRVRPMTLVSINSNRLWAGQRPHIGRRLLKRARLRLDRESVFALTWSALAQASPSLLRTLLRGVVRLRNFAVRDQVRRGEVYDWQPHVRVSPPEARAPIERPAAV